MWHIFWYVKNGCIFSFSIIISPLFELLLLKQFSWPRLVVSHSRGVEHTLYTNYVRFHWHYIAMFLLDRITNTIWMLSLFTKEQLHSLHPKSADHVWYNTQSVPAFPLVESRQTADWGVHSVCVQMHRLGCRHFLRTDVQTGVYTVCAYRCTDWGCKHWWCTQIGAYHCTGMTQSVQNGVCTNRNEYAENKMKIPLLNIFFKTHLYLEFFM